LLKNAFDWKTIETKTDRSASSSVYLLLILWRRFDGAKFAFKRDVRSCRESEVFKKSEEEKCHAYIVHYKL